MHDAIGSVRGRHDILAPHGIASNPLYLPQTRCGARRPLRVAMHAAHAPAPLQQCQGNLAADAAGGAQYECGWLVHHVLLSKFQPRCRAIWGARWIKEIVEV